MTEPIAENDAVNAAASAQWEIWMASMSPEKRALFDIADRRIYEAAFIRGALWELQNMVAKGVGSP